MPKRKLSALAEEKKTKSTVQKNKESKEEKKKSPVKTVKKTKKESDYEEDSEVSGDEETEDEEESKEEKKLLVYKEPVRRLFVPGVKETPVNCVYILKLLKPGTNLVYVGSTVNFLRRIRQHNKFLSTARSFTRDRTCDGKYRWTPICILSSESFTKQEILSIETKIKKAKACPLRLADNLPAKNGWKKANGKAIRAQIKRMLITVCLDKWTKKCTRSAVGVPLKISWFIPEEMPKSLVSYLPSYVTEEIVTDYSLPTK